MPGLPCSTAKLLPTNTTSAVQEEPLNVRFERALMNLINLDIAGHLDTETIVALLVSYGYILEPRDPNSIPKVQNYNRNLGAQAIYEAHQQDKVELSKAVQQAGHIAEDDVQYVMDRTGWTQKWAKPAVENARVICNVAPFFVPPERQARDLEHLPGA
ncbi:hypothetical protein MMC31_007845 [Peltigera leucophlebia]|nr:hypothetical protein [Peltigera leucophlebia]